jgi:hypothetical protein
MAAGATLDDVLRAFRTQDQFSPFHSIKALRKIAGIGLSCAMVIVDNSCGGRSYAHLTLTDLELLSHRPSHSGVDSSTYHDRENAIIERKPYLLYVRDRLTTRSVDLYTSATPLDTQPTRPGGSITGDGVTFERVCDNVRKSAAAWPTELRILRDEPDQLLLHFLRAPSGS